MTSVASFVLRRAHHDFRPVDEASHRALSSHETLLGSLFGNAHALSDRRPACTSATRLVDKVAEDLIGELVELRGNGGRLRELV
jgi:hypothetical protein